MISGVLHFFQFMIFAEFDEKKNVWHNSFIHQKIYEFHYSNPFRAIYSAAKYAYNKMKRERTNLTHFFFFIPWPQLSSFLCLWTCLNENIHYMCCTNTLGEHAITEWSFENLFLNICSNLYVTLLRCVAWDSLLVWVSCIFRKTLPGWYILYYDGTSLYAFL